MSRILVVLEEMPLDLLLHKNSVDTSEVDKTLELAENRHLAIYRNFLPIGTKVKLPTLQPKPVKEVIQLWN